MAMTFCFRRFVVNRGGLDVVDAARLGRRPRRRGHQRGDLQRRRFFQFSRCFHGGKIRTVAGGKQMKNVIGAWIGSPPLELKSPRAEDSYAR
jgi:hypothetical protein